MFKYEQEINQANKDYQEQYQICKDAYKDIVDDEDFIHPDDAVMCRFMAFGDGECIVEGYESFKGSLSFNARIAIKKYYSFVEGEGYVRVREAKGCFGIDRSDRDQFEQNDIKYPREGGLYMIGQTFFNPITDEKYYWIKVGEASNLKRRRREYNTTTAMIWDIGYYTGNDLTESGCHEKLKEICLHRHADEWFSVSREEYLKICENGFDWFKEA